MPRRLLADGGPEVSGVNLANRDAQRVGGVVRPRDVVEVQQRLDHPLDLALVGLAVAGDGQFDLARGEFTDRFSVVCGGQSEHAPGLGHGNTGSDILFEIDLFNAHSVGLEFGEKTRSFLEDDPEAIGEGLAATLTDRAHYERLQANLPAQAAKFSAEAVTAPVLAAYRSLLP